MQQSQLFDHRFGSAVMTELKQTKRRIPWHRTRFERELLAELTRRSDWWGLLQTLGTSAP